MAASKQQLLYAGDSKDEMPSKLCCGWHVQTVSLLMLAADLFFVAVGIAVCIGQLSSGSYAATRVDNSSAVEIPASMQMCIGTLGCLVLHPPLIVLAVVGVVGCKRVFLIPFLVCKLVSLLVVFGCMLFVLLSDAVPLEPVGRHSIALVLFVQSHVQVWILCVLCKCFNYFAAVSRQQRVLTRLSTPVFKETQATKRAGSS